MATDGVLGMVVGSLQRLEDSMGRLSADMRSELSKLPEQYVHRREADRRFDELTVDLGQERASRETDIRDTKDQVRDLERRLGEGRRWFIGLACGTGVSAIGLVLSAIDKLA